MAVLCLESFGVLLSVQNYGIFPDTTTANEVSLTNPDETENGNSEQLEGENIIHDQKMEGWSSQKSIQQELKEEGKYKN